MIVLYVLFHPSPMYAQGMEIPVFWESIHLGWLSVTSIKRVKRKSAPYTFRTTFLKDLSLFHECNIVWFSVPLLSRQRKFQDWSCIQLFYKGAHKCNRSLHSRSCGLGNYTTILSSTVLKSLKSLTYTKMHFWHFFLNAVKVWLKTLNHFLK